MLVCCGSCVRRLAVQGGFTGCGGRRGPTSVLFLKPGVQPSKVPESSDDFAFFVLVLWLIGSRLQLVRNVRLQAPPLFTQHISIHDMMTDSSRQ